MRNSLAMYAKSRRDGGQATAAKWTLLSPENAEFSPTISQEAAPNDLLHRHQRPERGPGQGDGQIHLDRRGGRKNLDATHRAGHQSPQRHLHPTRRRRRLDLRVDGESGIRPVHGSLHGRLRRPVQTCPRELHRDRLWKRLFFFPRPVLLLDERKRARSRSALRIPVSSSYRGPRKRTPTCTSSPSSPHQGD